MFNSRNEAYREHLAELNARYPDKSTLTLEECAAELGVSKRTVTRRIADKKNPLPAKKKGRGYIFTKVNLAMYMCGR